MTDGHAARWVEVGRHLRRRIFDELKLTKAEFIRLSGISDKTLSRYLDGQPIRRRDKERALSAAARWSPDSIERILNGGEPVGLLPDEPAHPPAGDGEETWGERLERLEADYERLAEELRVEQAKVAVLQREKEAREAAEREREERRHRGAS